MKSKKIVQTLGLAAVMAVSTGAFAHGNNDDHRAGPGGPAFQNQHAYVHGNNDHHAVPNAPAFQNHHAYQEGQRLMREINARQEQQHNRILAGYNQKRITQHEFRRLMGEQNEIRNMERAFLSDGFLNRYEYQRLDMALDNSSRHIFQQAHDDQGRPGGWNNSYGYGNWSR